MLRNVDREDKKSPKIGVKFMKKLLVFAVVLLIVIVALFITLLCVKLLKKENSVTTNEPGSTLTIPEITTTPFFTTSTFTTEDTTTTEIISTTTLDDSTSTSTTDDITTSTIESSSLSSSVGITSPSTTETTSTESITISLSESSSTTSTVTPTSTVDPQNYILYSRADWTGSDLNSAIKLLVLPLNRVIVAHTADSAGTCSSKAECLARIQTINSTNLNLLDVPYNYFIGGDGNVYEGRGYRHEGEHTNNIYGSNYNDIGIGIAFIGTYENEAPTQRQIDALDDFLYDLVENGTLSSDSKIFYQDQLKFNSVRSTALNNQVKNMTNFYDLQKIYSREEWESQNPCGSFEEMINPQNRSIVYHTATPWMCIDFANCTSTLKNIQSGVLNTCSFSDVFYGFVIGGNSDFSMVMEVRGFSNMGAHYVAYNRWSIAVALIGDYDTMIPGVAMINALEGFLKDAVALGKLSEDYILSPRIAGTNLINIIQTMPHYAPLP